MPLLMFLSGAVLFGAGSWAFLYARYHDPTPGADPMAVHLLSHPAYERLHYGGIGLLALAALLIAGAVVSWVRSAA